MVAVLSVRLCVSAAQKMDIGLMKDNDVMGFIGPGFQFLQDD